MKHVKYLLFLSFIVGSLQAQNTLDIPSSGEFLNYLHARQDAIEEKLYYLLLSQKIKPYKNDSFASMYNITEFKERGGMEKRLEFENYVMIKPDSTLVPFSPKGITGIWFAEHVGSGKEIVSINTLKGIALAYQPVFFGTRLTAIPLCWIKTADLVKNLPRQDLEFLLQLLHYGRNGNFVLEIPGTDAFYALNTSGQRTIVPDSNLYNRITKMLTSSQFYIEDQIYFAKGPKSLAGKIYDEQLRRVITLDTFNQRYQREALIFIQTDPGDPTQGRDSTIYVPHRLDKVYAVNYDKQLRQITHYRFSLYIPGVKRQEVHTFSIPVNRNYTAAKPVIWFYEDYIRWKGL